jgi:hypothetical protein
MGTDVIGGPHDFLPPRSDEFQNVLEYSSTGNEVIKWQVYSRLFLNNTRSLYIEGSVHKGAIGA